MGSRRALTLPVMSNMTLANVRELYAIPGPWWMQELIRTTHGQLGHRAIAKEGLPLGEIGPDLEIRRINIYRK